MLWVSGGSGVRCFVVRVVCGRGRVFSFEHAGQRSRWRTRFSQNVLLPHVGGEGNAQQVGGVQRVVRVENEEIEW